MLFSARGVGTKALPTAQYNETHSSGQIVKARRPACRRNKSRVRGDYSHGSSPEMRENSWGARTAKVK